MTVEEIKNLSRELEEQRKANQEITKKYEEESSYRNEAERKYLDIRDDLQRFKGERDQVISSLEGEMEQVRQEAEEELRKRCGHLLAENRFLHEKIDRGVGESGFQSEAEQPGVSEEATDQGTPGDRSDQASLAERLSQMEIALKRTIDEAQSFICEQRKKESGLEDKLKSMAQALEEERDEHRRERDHWRSREGEMKEMMEQTLDNRRRTINEELYHLYPRLVNERPITATIAPSWKKVAVFSGFALLAFLVFFTGYLALSSLERDRGKQVGLAASKYPSTGFPKADEGSRVQSPLPPNSKKGYEELWKELTVQSLSNDIRIQATLHSREELEAALRFSADKEAWNQEQLNQALAELSDTFQLERYFYVTIFSKNMRGGYPGYADAFEKHLAIRDNDGNEAAGMISDELRQRKIITSHIVSAGKEINSDFLYEVGITVSFPRRKLVPSPEKLQLVLYDVGAVPIRVLTWDLSGRGSSI